MTSKGSHVYSSQRLVLKDTGFEAGDALAVFAEELIDAEHVVVLLGAQLSNLAAEFGAEIAAVAAVEEQGHDDHEGRNASGEDGIDEGWIHFCSP